MNFGQGVLNAVQTVASLPRGGGEVGRVRALALCSTSFICNSLLNTNIMTTQLNSVSTPSSIPGIVKGTTGSHPKWEPKYGPYPHPEPGEEDLLRMEPESKEVYTLMAVCLAFSIWLAGKSTADRQARLNYHANPVKPKDVDQESHDMFKKMRLREVGYMEIILASFDAGTAQANMNKMASKIERLGILTDRPIYCTAASFLTTKTCPAKFKTLKATVPYTITNAQSAMSDHWII